MDHTRRYRSGMAAYDAGRFIEAIEHLAPLAKGGRGTVSVLSRFYLGQAHYRLAHGHFEARRFADAARHFQASASANPSGGDFARFLAVCHVGMGQLDRASEDFDRLLARHPGDATLRIRSALARHRLGHAVEALSILQEGLRRCVDHAELHYQLGVILAAEGEVDEAERQFERVIDLDASHAAAHERLAQCFGARQQPRRALEHLETANRLEPGNSRIALQLSILAQEIDDPDLRERLRLRRPATPRYDERDLDRLSDAILSEPEFVQAFLSLPPSEVDQEVFGLLAATLERALAGHPEYADLHYHCSAVYRRLGKARDAIDHAERAVRINPRYTDALILLARLYGQTDRCVPAIERLEEAVRNGADYPDVHYLLGGLYQRSKRQDMACRAYERALELNRNYSAAREALAALTV